MPMPKWILRLDGERQQKAMTVLAEYEQSKNNARLALDKILADAGETIDEAQEAYKTAVTAARRRYTSAKERIEATEGVHR